MIESDALAHTLEEGGDWRSGYSPDYSVLVMRDGRVFDRVCQARRPFTVGELAHIEAVVTGKWSPSHHGDTALTYDC